VEHSIHKSRERRTPLSEKHRTMLEEESGISPEVIVARGYYTAFRRADVPAVFSEKQRKLGLVVPLYSPDGETVSYQLRPNKQRHKGPKYLTPRGGGNIVDVHPLMRGAIKDVSVPLWITEGAKTGDALTSRGICTAVFAGVYNFAIKDTRSKELLPCFAHIPLQGRLVYIVYDADARTNADVQEALRRLVARLEERGARVLVIYVPTVNGDSKAGADDYLAAGESLEELEQSARPYEPVDIPTERLRRVEGLQGRIRALWASWAAMPATRQAECSDRATMRDLVREAERTGKVVEEGVRVMRSARDGALACGRALGGWKASIDRLEAAGRLRRDYRISEPAGAYILLTPSPPGSAEPEHYRERDAHRESRKGEKTEKHLSRNPLVNAISPLGVHSLRASAEEVPELRWPKVVLFWGRKDGERVVVDSYYVRRLGKRRREMLVYMLAVGGSAPKAELLEMFGTEGEEKRPRDFKRRGWGPLEEAGIVTDRGANLDITPAWREALEERRRADEEIRDAERQAARYAEGRKKYRQRHEHPADKEPPLMNRERVKEIVEERAKEDAERRIQREREKVGMTPAVFLADALGAAAGIRWQELRERWIVQGGKSESLRQAVRSGPFTFKREIADGALYVYRAAEVHRPDEAEESPASVAVLHDLAPLPSEPPPPKRPPKDANGIYQHGPFCDCDWCSHELEPRYATPFVGSGV
jgi:hypothetical protein